MTKAIDRKLAAKEAEEIRKLLKRAARDIATIGQKLIAVKAALNHGEWGEWLRREFDWDSRTAQRFMSVGERFKNDNLSDLDIAPSALYLLAAASTPDAVSHDIISRARAGARITHKDALDAIKQARELLSVAKQAEDTNATWPDWVEPDTRAALTVMAIQFPDEFNAMTAARIAEMLHDHKAAELLAAASSPDVIGWAQAHAAMWRARSLRDFYSEPEIDVEALQFAEQLDDYIEGGVDSRADVAIWWRKTYCCLCENPVGTELAKAGSNNPFPLSKFGRCCDACNKEKVGKARASVMMAAQDDRFYAELGELRHKSTTANILYDVATKTRNGEPGGFHMVQVAPCS